MAEPWWTIIGLGEDGPAGLSPASHAALAAGKVIFGGPRHLKLLGVQGHEWPLPFSVTPLLAHRGKKVVALASGDLVNPDFARLAGRVALVTGGGLTWRW